jgi:sirohydrochlorin ferrochelatase
VLADPLGADAAVAQLVADRYDAALRGSLARSA